MREIQKTLCSRWMQEVWNEGRTKSIDDLLSEDVIIHGLATDDQLKGSEAFKKYYDDFRKEFEDIHIKVEDVVSQDDIESVLCTVTATQSSSKKKVSFSGQCMVRIENGKIAEAWNHFDFYNMYLQLGYTLTL